VVHCPLQSERGKGKVCVPAGRANDRAREKEKKKCCPFKRRGFLVAVFTGTGKRKVQGVSRNRGGKTKIRSYRQALLPAWKKVTTILKTIARNWVGK